MVKPSVYCLGEGEGTKWRKVNKMAQSRLLPGSSSPTFLRPGKCRTTEHAPGDVNPKRSKLTRPRLRRHPYHALILPTALPLPVPMHKSLPPAGAGVTSSAPAFMEASIFVDRRTSPESTGVTSLAPHT
uniref:Uncharacterized protein n=1 Tax=Macaca fascicularis TaxID=9541 RepID=A0A7N9CY26_MACFA